MLHIQKNLEKPVIAHIIRATVTFLVALKRQAPSSAFVMLPEKGIVTGTDQRNYCNNK